MRRLGEFDELWADVSGPSLCQVQGVLDDTLRRRAGLYLAQGGIVRFTMERVPDVIDGENVFLSAAIRTDGEWYWRSDLAHYVLKYGVGLDPDFMEHAAAHLWTPDVLTDQDLTRVAKEIRTRLHVEETAAPEA